MEMAADGRIRFDGFITHRFPLKDYRDAFQMIQKHPESVVKVILEMK
jgi:threonine dehydrogenase-like Zn-dependent dehydrogenase